MTKILSGKNIAEEIKIELKTKVDLLISAGKRPPHLAAILVGDNAPSRAYVAGKVAFCKQVGYKSTLIHLSDNISEEELLDEVQKLNDNKAIDGFIVQLPIPKHIDEQKIIMAIRPEKDVDGFHPQNMGNLVLGLPGFVSATPAGIIEIIKRSKIETEGKHCVVLGRSNIVGSPMSILLAKKAYPGNCTVTLAHSRTQNIEGICQQADILIAAIGNAKFVKESMVKEGAVVIDVGINRVIDSSKAKGYRLEGDVDFENVSKKCSAISPVPGGVGPMTIVSLMLNTYKAYELKMKN